MTLFRLRQAREALGIFMVLAACGGAPAATPVPATTAPARLKVVATFSILGDFVANVGGDKLNLSVLVPAGGDAHDFEPAPSDAARIADAALLFENGVEFESWLDALYKASGSKAGRVIVSDGIELRASGEHLAEQAASHATPDAKEAGHTQGEHDPHVWQDVKNAIRMVRNIETALVIADAPNAGVYKANAAAYIAKLEALDAEIVQAVEALPSAGRKIVTSHDALGYFGERYGFDIVGEVIGGLSTEAGEPSAQEVVKLVDAIEAQGVKAIFPESVTNPKLVERVAVEAGVKVGGELYTDALGEPGSSGATYIDAMRTNVKTLLDALK